MTSEKRIYLFDRESFRREQEESSRRRMALPHCQKCSWCGAKPIRAVAPYLGPGYSDDDIWTSACVDHLDLLKKTADEIKGNKVIDIITENDPVARASLEALKDAVTDHMTGNGMARHATVDFGVKCSSCGRSNLVLVKVESEWHLGCAYAIGQGLCTNYAKISEVDADLLAKTKSVIQAVSIIEKRR